MVDRAVIGYEPFFDVKVVVFPELAHTAPIYETVAELSDRLAVPIPNEHTDSYVHKARDRSIYIQRPKTRLGLPIFTLATDCAPEPCVVIVVVRSLRF